MPRHSSNRDVSKGNFSNGLKELRQARKTQSLSLIANQTTVKREDTGTDPYNTSGSFDRKKNWTRVGRR